MCVCVQSCLPRTFPVSGRALGERGLWGVWGGLGGGRWARPPRAAAQVGAPRGPRCAPAVPAGGWLSSLLGAKPGRSAALAAGHSPLLAAGPAGCAGGERGRKRPGGSGGRSAPSGPRGRQAFGTGTSRAAWRLSGGPTRTGLLWAQRRTESPQPGSRDPGTPRLRSASARGRSVRPGCAPAGEGGARRGGGGVPRGGVSPRTCTKGAGLRAGQEPGRRQDARRPAPWPGSSSPLFLGRWGGGVPSDPLAPAPREPEHSPPPLPVPAGRLPGAGPVARSCRPKPQAWGGGPRKAPRASVAGCPVPGLGCPEGRPRGNLARKQLCRALTSRRSGPGPSRSLRASAASAGAPASPPASATAAGG